MRTLLLATIAVLGIIRIVSGLECYWNTHPEVNGQTVSTTTWKDIFDQLKAFLPPSTITANIKVDGDDIKQILIQAKGTDDCTECQKWKTPRGLMQFCISEKVKNASLLTTLKKKVHTEECNDTPKCNGVEKQPTPAVKCFHGNKTDSVKSITYNDFYSFFEKATEMEFYEETVKKDDMKPENNKYTVDCTHCLTAITLKAKVPLCGFYHLSDNTDPCGLPDDKEVQKYFKIFKNNKKCCYDDGCNAKPEYKEYLSTNLSCYFSTDVGVDESASNKGVKVYDLMNALNEIAPEIPNSDKYFKDLQEKFFLEPYECDRCATVSKSGKSAALCIPKILVEDHGFCEKDGVECCDTPKCNPLSCYENENKKDSINKQKFTTTSVEHYVNRYKEFFPVYSENNKDELQKNLTDKNNEGNHCRTCAVYAAKNPPMQACSYDAMDKGDCQKTGNAEPKAICCTSNGCNKILLRCYTNEIYKRNTRTVYTSTIDEFQQVVRGYDDPVIQSDVYKPIFRQDRTSDHDDSVDITCKSCATLETEKGYVQMCFYADTDSEECKQKGMNCCDDTDDCNKKDLICYQGKNNETVTNSTIKTFWNYLSLFAMEEMDYPHYPEYGLGQEMNVVHQCLYCLSIETKYGTLPLCGFNETFENRLSERNKDMAGGYVTGCMTDFCNDIGYKMVEGQATNLRNTAVTTILFSLITLSLFPFPY